MIFGKSYKEKYKEKQEKLQRLKSGRIWFAWFPVKEINGRWVWLQKVKINYGIYEFDGELRIGSKAIIHLITILIALTFILSTPCLGAFYCETGEVIQEDDTIAKLINNECGPFYKYGEKYYMEHWLYKGRNGFIYQVNIEQGVVVSIENQGR